MYEGFDPIDRRLPIKLDTASSGEFMPGPLGALAQASQLAHQGAVKNP